MTPDVNQAAKLAKYDGMKAEVDALAEKIAATKIE